MTINPGIGIVSVGRSRLVLFAVLTGIATAIVVALMLVRPPVAISTTSPTWLDDSAGTQNRIEQVPGLFRERTTGGGEYLSQFNSPIAGNEDRQSLTALVR